MKTLYIDCGMGAAGDMLTAALLELLPDKEAFLRKLNGLGIPGVSFEMEASEKCGIRGTHVTVKVNGMEEESLDVHAHEHHHDHEHHAHEHCCESLHGHEYQVHPGETGEPHAHGLEAYEHEHHHDHEHGPEAHDHEHHHDHHDHGEPGHHHHHSGMHDIEHIVRDHLKVSDRVREDILAVYRLIAEAESHAHGVPVSEIHFHEVGTMDAVADIAAVCMLMERLDPDEVIASPVHVGSGHVHCAHGILPVPAPATAFILKDVPIYGGSVEGELCTPTGAALLKHFVTCFGDMPVMKVSAIGYGMGKKDFARANCVRVMLGETEGSRDMIYELSCNVDDMTAEEIGFATEMLMAEGALEVYTIPIGMKKSRPGTLIKVMCRPEQREVMVRLIFKYTETIGIREIATERYVLDRSIEEKETPFGRLRRKISEGYGVRRCKYEYDDLSRMAREKGSSIEEIKKELGI